jgi:uroporphyrinogen-III decarboxylase
MSAKPQADFSQHNAEAQAVWDAYRAGHPIRVPVVIGTNTRFFLVNEELNPGQKITFQDYSEDPEVMVDFQLRASAWRANHIAPLCDDPAGLPEVFHVRVDLQNYYEAAHLGAPIHFRDGQVPDTVPILAGDRKHLLFDRGLPDPLTGGVFGRAHEFHAAIQAWIDGGLTYLDRPVVLDPFGLGTDGPLTVATNLRGYEFYMDFYDDPDYAHQLLDFVTQAAIRRIQAHRAFFGQPPRAEDWGFADDSLALISTDLYRSFVLPYHRRMKEELAAADRIGVHLCGDATRHFKTLRDELGAYRFDTGFPVDFTALRQELGPEVEILGGPSVMVLQAESPEGVEAETQRILQSGILEGGHFILREGNNLAPHTPLDNLAAMYRAARRWGGFPRN